MTGDRLSPDALKRALRQQALAARRAAHLTHAETAGERIAAAFLGAFAPAAGQVVAGYWPMGEEADVRPLLERLAASRCNIALPVVIEKRSPLVFRLWQPGQALEPGAHGTRQPPADATEAKPTLLLLPLLAFDARGGRLGYGGGYYDRTLAALRRSGCVIAVGVAYAAQELAVVPRGGHDESLDWIVTEEGAREALR